jgi:hypothetical protein
MKFKVGDKVICTQSISMSEGGPCSGEVYTITSVCKDHIGFALPGLNPIKYPPEDINGTQANWGTMCFARLPVVGDRVFVGEDNPNDSDLKYGDACAVHSFIENKLCLLDSNGETWFVDPDHLIFSVHVR